jgi:hypothetical protein
VGVALGSIMPAIMIAHIANIMPKCAGVQGCNPIIAIGPASMARAMSTR